MRLISLLLAIIIPLLPCVTASAQNVEYINSTLWTDLRDMKVVDNLAYCAFPNGLVILDVSDLSNPTILSQLYCHGRAYKIDVSGNYAYLQDGFSGIQIISIEDPENPVLVGNYADETFWYYEIQVDGNYLYCTVPDLDSVLQVVDVADPANPFLAGQFNAHYSIEDFYVIGNLAYLLHDYELEILDISDLSDPISVGSYVTECLAWEIQVVGDYAYIRESEYEGCQTLEILDISDPGNPSLVGIIPSYANITSMLIRGNLAFITMGILQPITSWLNIYDISNPELPVYLETYHGSFAFRFATDTHMYLTQGRDLSIIDIDSYLFPERVIMFPRRVGEYEFPGDINDVFIEDGYAYVICGNLDRGREMRVVDISDPYNLVETANCRLKVIGSDIYVADNLAYIAQRRYDWGSAGLQIIDVSNPEDPVFAGSCETEVNAYYIFVDDGYAYLALREGYPNYNGALQVVDVSDPGNPALAGSYEIESRVMDVSVAGDYAYITVAYCQGDSGCFRVLDVSDPDNPILCSTYLIDGPRDIFVDGIYAYIVDINSSLIILDISDPMQPEFMGSYPFDDIRICGFVNNGYAYIGADYDFFILDVQNPGQPTLVCSYEMPGSVKDIYVDGEYIYVASRSSLIVLRFDPTFGIDKVGNPPVKSVFSQNYPNPFNAQTTIRYSLPTQSMVLIDVFDILGRKANTLIQENQPAGQHSVVWNADDLPSGVYFYRIQAGVHSEINKVVLLK